ncbi:hypothetical protein FQA39_LY09837 [Lamprigera yunnana]|nr:hypothetical protein FQA39_LY09837 [Lamprigera yunnana]
MAKSATYSGVYDYNLEDEKMNLTHYEPESIRNVCILAHVDHGKTSVADCLLTLNGLVSKHYVGKTKYLDDRPDEQDRHITMKCSSISIGLNLKLSDDQNCSPLLINLVDTPGHIDFSTEVTAATRISDGALIVVDVVEGVSSQTKAALKQALEEKLDMILVLNKVDRLVVDLKLSPIEIFFKLNYLVQSCNVYISSLQDWMVDCYEDYVEDVFNPVIGNVIFASAIDSWGFTLRDIAETYNHLVVGESVSTFTKKLWDEDLYISSKDRRIKNGGQKKGIKSVFVQLACSMIDYIYQNLSMRGNLSVIPKITASLGLNISLLSLKYGDCRKKLKCIMEAWKPLGEVVARQCYYLFPSPTEMPLNRIEYLLNLNRYSISSLLSERIQKAIKAIHMCKSDEIPISYITKLILVNKHAQPLLSANFVCSDDNSVLNFEQFHSQHNDRLILALIRIYSGTIYPGQVLHAFSTEYDPYDFMLTEDQAMMRLSKQRCTVTIKDVYILLGSEIKSVKCLRPGYICGVTFVEDLPFSTATLSETSWVPPIIEQPRMEPILYNVITPTNPAHSNTLRLGLQLLQRFDTCLKTSINNLGEYVVATAGTVHLEKCLTDLRNNFIDVEFTVSPPIYALRETVKQLTMLPLSRSIELNPSCKIYIELSVVALPIDLVNIIHLHYGLLNVIQYQEMATIGEIHCSVIKNEVMTMKSKEFIKESYNKAITKLMELLTSHMHSIDVPPWNSIDALSIMGVSNSKHNINILLNDVRQYISNVFTPPSENDPRLYIFTYLINAFNLACNVGPICKEPLTNCAFILHDLSVIGDIRTLLESDIYAGNNITHQCRQLFHDVVLKGEVAIMEPVFTATIESNVDFGVLCTEVLKHHGSVVAYVGKDESIKTDHLKVEIPAIESERFIASLRKVSSGNAAMIICDTYHYKVLLCEDYVVDEENVEDTKEKSAEDRFTERESKLVKETRIRKGIILNDQVVINAEKQRTLKK